MRPTNLCFERLAESLPHLVWSCRGDGPCDYLSPQWVAYTGISEAEQLGFGWLNQLHPDDRARTHAQWSDAVARRGRLDTEFRIRRHDGEYRLFKTRAEPELAEDGSIARWYGTNTDIQELRDSQEQLSALNAELEDRVAERSLLADENGRALRRATEQLEAAQAITHTGSWGFDLATGTVTWSAELFRIMRLPVSEAAPPFDTQHTLYMPKSLALLQDRVAHTIKTGIGYELELQLADSAEGPRFVVARGEAQVDTSGRVTHLLGTLQDVTELVRTREERDRVNQRMQLATTGAGIGIWDWDIVADTVTWDARMRQLYGVDSSVSPTYRVWLDAVHPEDRAAADTQIQRALAGTAHFEVSFRIPQPSGWERHVRSKAELFRDRDGKPLRMVGVNWDVTAEATAQAFREESTRLLKEFIRNAPAAIAMLDTRLHYIEASDRWMSDYGVEREAVLGRHHYEVFASIPERWKVIHQSVLAGAVCRHDADLFPQPDGTNVWLQWEARPWFRSGGEIGGALFFTRDVSDSVSMQRALAQRTDALERSNYDLQQFAYAASHDLQEPLRAVAGCAQIFAQRYRDLVDSQGVALITHMVEGADRMRQLIDDLLAYSRVDTHGSTWQPVAMGEAVDEALANLSASVAQSGAEIVVEGLPTLTVDGRQVTQLFQNLIGNSIKYAGPHAPVIRIRGWQESGRWTFAVRDNGIGIPAEARDRIFVIFQRLHTREEYPGTGIGLALCRRIVERHGGRIWVEPVDGVGTEFRFTLKESEA